MMTEGSAQIKSLPSTPIEASPGSGMDRLVSTPKKPWWRTRQAFAAYGVVAVAILLWQALPAQGSTDVAGDDIQTGEVQRAPFDDYLPVRAKVVPAVTTLVGLLSGGQVAERFVEDGDLVTEGQPLARIANPDLELQVLTQEAQIASQLGGVAGQNLGIQRSRIDRAGQVAAAEYDLIQAQRELNIREQLREQGFVSEAGVKGYREEVQYQRKRLSQLRSGSAAEAGITADQSAQLNSTRRRLQSTLEAVRGSLDALTIRAPRAGRLTNFDLQPGQTLEPGDPAGQVDSEGEWKLEADVDEYYLGRVEIGQSATASDGTQLVVSKVLPTVTEGRFRVELTFETLPDQRLNRGQALDVQITLGASQQAVIAPVGGWLNKGGNSVFVLDEDGDHARRMPIEIGRRNPRQVEIISGPQPGDRIITSDLPQVEGDIINIR